MSESSHSTPEALGSSLAQKEVGRKEREGKGTGGGARGRGRKESGRASPGRPGFSTASSAARTAGFCYTQLEAATAEIGDLCSRFLFR